MVESIYFLKPAWCGTHFAGLWPEQGLQPVTRATALRRWFVTFTGSIADVKGFPAISVYSATKAAIRSFARTLTNELKDRRIRVNTISPGHIDTPIFDTWQEGDALTKMKEDLAKTVPLGRLGDPDEIAKAVSFLASHEASYVAGIELYVDGGVAQI